MTITDPEPVVVTAGIEVLSDALEAQGVTTARVDWRPPVTGTEDALARVMLDPRRRAANERALAAMLAAQASLVDVRPASDALGLARGQFLHAGPPISWDRASGPLRGALVGAVLYEGWADTPERAETDLARGGVRARALPPPRRRRPDGRRHLPVHVGLRACGRSR